MNSHAVVLLTAAAIALTACAQNSSSSRPTGRKALVVGRGLPLTEPDGGPTHPQGAKNNFLTLVNNPSNNPARGWTCDLTYDLQKQLGLPDDAPLPRLFSEIARRNLGYRIVMQNGANGVNLELWGAAVDAGIMPFAPQGNNNPGQRFPDGLGLRAAAGVAGGVTANTSSYGPGVEFIDALPNGDAAQSWANQVVAAKFARVLDDHPRYNIWDARQHLRQAASNWEQGWNERTGYGRVDLGRRVDKLMPAPPVEFRTKVIDNGHRVQFTWRNFLQTDFAATVITRRDGRVIYDGQGTNFVWRSDVNGDETFVYVSRNRSGEKSRIESFQRRVVTNLYTGIARTALVLGTQPAEDRVNLPLARAFLQTATNNWAAHVVFRKGNPVYDSMQPSPGGPIIGVAPDVATMVTIGITNDYRILLPAISVEERDLFQYKEHWDRAVASGLLVVMPHSASFTRARPAGRRTSPPRLFSAITVGAGTVTNQYTYGPGLECYDTLPEPVVIGGGLLTQMDAAAAVAAKLARILDNNPNYNIWDARQHLRQTCDKYSAGWVEDGGFGRPSSKNVRLGALDPAPPVDIEANVENDGRAVRFSWQNFLQSSFRETVVQREDGRTLYSGTGTNYVWKSDVTGEAVFRVLSRDKSGRLSRPEPFTEFRLSGLNNN
jgi:hypothetical protein